jgi:septum formation protein
VLDGVILNKPATSDEAVQMLERLSGRAHTVFTGFALVQKLQKLQKQRDGTDSWAASRVRIVTDVCATSVYFRALQDEEIRAYVASGSPMDKAGAYGIQDDFGAVFVERVEGCYYNVVGLPLQAVYSSLRTLLE